tara:strand:+ start:1740 stop:4670 length:2931 start_codon:yes stop_codon:yes gene_type:complete
MASQKVWNSDFVDSLNELETISKNKGEMFRARAYKTASDTILAMSENIYDVEQLKDKRGIGKTIFEKLKSLVETGKINAIEREKSNVLHQLCKIYGVGPKKALDLSNKVSSIEELKSKQDLLNDKQKIGLFYFEDIQKRIPRAEIEEYDTKIQDIIKDLKLQDGSINAEIVGSFRRGALSSGDIDIIFTSDDPKSFSLFLEKVSDANMILAYLSKGSKKSLTIGTLGKDDSIARRIDFLYSPPKEYPFAILYFTGSMAFNVVMRRHALTLGYSLNEHGFTPAPINENFKTEQDIFDFLGQEYKSPSERSGAASVVLKGKNDVINMNGGAKDKKPDISLKKKTRSVKKMKYDGSQFDENYKSMDLGDIVKLIRRASDAYYNSSPIMTDAEFDILRDHVESVAPDHPVLKEIGAPVVSRHKVTLPYFMPSMDKVKPESLDKWLNTYKGPYVISAKLDGVSAMYVQKSDSINLYTRGNGSVGQDISHLIQYISNIPSNNGEDMVIRGELIISDSDFEKNFANEKANARNMVSGLVSRKNGLQKNRMKYVHFVAYEVISPVLSPLEQMKFAEKKNFEVVHNETIDKMSVEKASDTLVNWRKNDEYSIDGIIISQNDIFQRENSNPKHSVAFKMVLSDQSKESVVTGVTWNTSKHGLKKPIVQIEPINIGGVTVRNISGQNGKFIESNMIGPGAIIEVVRRGDVIPYIEKVIKPANKPAMPDGEYEWTATNVDIIVPVDDESRERLALAFFKDIGVDGVGIGNIKKFSKAGFKTIPQILKMTKEDILSIDGFKDKSAQKIYSGLQELQANNFGKVPIEKLMGLSGTFGRGIGSRRIKEIFKLYPDVLNRNISEGEMIELIQTVPGFSVKTATQFAEGLEKFKSFAQNIGLNYITQEASTTNVEKNKGGVLSGKSIVFTGGKDKELELLITENGGEIGSSVSSKTFAVVTKDINVSSTKTKKAISLGIPVYSIAVFQDMYLS